MLLAYVDESGDTGDVAKAGSASCFVLGCVLVHVRGWNASFDSLLNFRRKIREGFGPLLRVEFKANHLIRNGGGLRPLGLSLPAREA